MRKKSLAREIEEVSSLKPFQEGSDGESEVEGGEESEGEKRAHYVDVDQSRIQQQLIPSFHTKYDGSVTSRRALENVEDRSVGEDEEASDDLSDDSGDENNENDESVDEENHESGSIDDSKHASKSNLDAARQQVKNLLADEQKLAQNVALSQKVDAEKGGHVKNQLSFFDALLDCRMKIQKGLLFANEGTEKEEKEEVQGAVESAKRLLHSITNLRHEMMQADGVPQRKRQREEDSAAAQVRGLDDDLFAWRDDTLDKWSAKVHANSVGVKFKAINQSATNQIKDSLLDMDRLVKNTRLHRVTRTEERPSEDEDVYDDTTFYQQLLKDLVDKRMVDSIDEAAQQARWAVVANAKKKRKTYDVKASKGRKIRYEVHEKLQNFMSPQPFVQWPDRQVEDLFSSLLGSKKDGLHDQSEDKVVHDGLRVFA